jgi:phenylpyruvate tautomerase PptA (4-oxalocrotonate tautomerase family)
MPYIEFKATDRRFTDPTVAERLIATLTDAACEVLGEDARPSIWVVIQGIPAQQWGVGGNPLS